MANETNPILANIFEQPAELHRVLDDLCGPHLDKVREISALMQSYDRVVLTSMGSALYSLMPMYEALVDDGWRNVELVETATLIHHPERVHHDTLYLMMSRSGESREVADFAVWLDAHGHEAACVTMTPDSTMATHCAHVLHDVASYDKIVCIKAYSSMALCGLFIAHMAGRTEPDATLVSALHGAFDWMEASKRAILARLEEVPFLSATDCFYLISRDEGVNMARSASLWIEETAKVGANVMSADNFYHGPMELVRAQSITRTRTTPVLIDIYPDERSSMIWDYVNDAAPDSLYFGFDDSARAGARFTFPELDLDAPWMMLVEAIYFQLLSYQVALAHGVEPGMFFEDGWVVK